jgi:hypothetical protein
MGDQSQNLSVFLKKEADDILYKKGLMDILDSFGTPHIHGSYLLDLMTWRDLDIYLEIDHISETDFFLLGERVSRLLDPVKMNFRNEIRAKTNGLPAGLYWGIYLGNERAGAWKIDLWVVSSSECKRLLEFCNDVKQRLTEETKEIILEIKSQCWQDPEYRRSYSSADIYEAVLGRNVTSKEAFNRYLRSLKSVE